MNDPGRVVILGAGPTGLGAALGLARGGHDDFTVLEAATHPGGLASSFRDAAGFTWDIGGHVGFSHYAAYDRIIAEAPGLEWLEHHRTAAVWTGGRRVPYPFQYNLHRLAPADRERALRGLEEAARRPIERQPADFAEWIEVHFGRGLAELFFIPYNEKVWGYPLSRLGVSWMGRRVAPPDMERVRKALSSDRDDAHWGPNHTFRYPLDGGSGAVWQAVARLLPPGRLELSARVTDIDLDGRWVRLADGRRLTWDHLVSSLPLDRLCAMARGLEFSALRASEKLVKSACHAIGVGLTGARPDSLDDATWLYFPDDSSPYYRVTVLSNYSPHNAPSGCWSLLAEVCETPWRPVAADRIARQVVTALRHDGLIPGAAQITATWHHRVEHGYPTPFLGRDEVLGAVLPALERRRVFSRGRFGAWKYEVSNQDHSFMQGMEVAARLLGQGEEETLEQPDHVNSGALLHREGR